MKIETNYISEFVPSSAILANLAIVVATDIRFLIFFNNYQLIWQDGKQFEEYVWGETEVAVMDACRISKALYS
ncbi:Hypothetical predicted protein [Octopus vulgaris]|uniref:Uncharacterized protein n=1 Tax=Octopus vulgaris TaxID=6645 RepID=A0AA36EZK3_OCTVU|nr:Hypothetical predicted protein [Octopus vulgaris]